MGQLQYGVMGRYGAYWSKQASKQTLLGVWPQGNVIQGQIEETFIKEKHCHEKKQLVIIISLFLFIGKSMNACR